jgi:hypothetical protein
MDLFPQPIRQIPKIGSHADGSREPVIGVPFKMIEEILWIEVLLRHAAVLLIEESEVAVNVNHSGHDSLPGQIDPRGAARTHDFAFPSDTGESAVLDDECGVFNRRFPVTHDEPGAFKEHDPGWTLRLYEGYDRQKQEKTAKAVSNIPDMTHFPRSYFNADQKWQVGPVAL